MSTEKITAIHSSHLSFQIAAYIQKNASKPICIVLDNNARLSQTIAELKNFTASQLHHRFFVLPDWETLPYDHINAHRQIIAKRIQTLYQISQINNPILLISKVAYGFKLPPCKFILSQSFSCVVGQEMTTERFRKLMSAKGYDEVREVSDVGQFAIRGAILDIILTDHKKTGYRIELFDNEIDSIRVLDINSKRSSTPLDAIHIYPNREFVIDQQTNTVIKDNLHKCPEHLHAELLKALKSPHHIQGIEYYLPFLHEKLVGIADYLPENTHYIIPENHQSEQDDLVAQTEQRYQKQLDHNRPVANPNSLLSYTLTMPVEDYTFYALSSDESLLKAHTLPNLSDDKHTFENNPQLQKIYHSNDTIEIYAAVQTRAENLFHCLDSTNMPCLLNKNDHENTGNSKNIIIKTGTLRAGFYSPEKKKFYISENDLLGRVLDHHETSNTASINIAQVENWQVGTLIVHRDFGIGRFHAFTTIKRDGKASDFLVLEYANEDKLYVATNQFHLLSRYIGAQSKNMVLTSLAGKKWQLKKQKAIQNADMLAEQILSQHAQRNQAVAKKLTVSEHDLAQFCEYFPYTETPDQKKAIETVLEDIQKTQAMNRLLCGDVGFGKTEVAMRAAFVCAYSGNQAAILAPTTLLVKQHLETFTQRFGHFPIRIVMLSRLASKSEQASIKSALKNGEIDIIIATHGLLQPDIEFKNLGLLVIDEEHKFGVKQKELIQSISATAHTLAMSATPIPRTLHMTLAKLRDISIIATPPKNRQAIQTFVEIYSDTVVKEAIQRELQRGGQCYVVHNDIQSLEIIRDNITAMLPKATCRIMHAKQSKAILQQTMISFQHGDFDILLATTIIESGIDIPNANTMIIQRADLLGLSQIHQLRGRVGRSHHQAYAYLMTPPSKYMTEEGRARMHTLTKQKALGSGLNVALEDLEIRGAGNLLGKRQSGTAEEVGLSLYNEMLAKSTQKRMGITEQKSSGQIDIDLGMTTSIPETYVRDFASRLNYYRAISCAETTENIKQIQSELEDRYGMLPESLVNLLEFRRIQQRSMQLGIRKIVAKEEYNDIWMDQVNLLPSILKTTQIGKENIKILGDRIRLYRDIHKGLPLEYLNENSK